MNKENNADSKNKDLKEWLKKQCFAYGDLDITDLMERISRPLSEDVSDDKALCILNQSEEWQQQERKSNDLFDEFYKKDFDKTSDLFDAVAGQQAMYGDACYMVGLKDGIGFMLWAMGKKQAQLYGWLTV